MMLPWPIRKEIEKSNVAYGLQYPLTFVSHRIRLAMNTIHETELFSDWIAELRDLKARMRILARVNRARVGNFGDYKVLGDGICEMKIDYGPGYRVYYAQEGLNVYLLILGGDKTSQIKDIARAKGIWRTIMEERQ